MRIGSTHPRIINVWGPKEARSTGADAVYERCWREMSKVARILVLKSGEENAIGGRDRATPNFQEASIRFFTPSTNLLFQKMAARLFRDKDTQVLANLDALSFAASTFLRFRGAIMEADFVHTYNFWFVVIATMFPSLRRKVVYTELGGDWKFVADGNEDRLTRIRYAYLGRVFLNRCKVIAQSPLQSSYLIRSGIRKSSVRIVQHARVDPGLFHPAASKNSGVFNVLFVGRVIPQKGVHILLKAALVVIKKCQCTDIRFTIVGPIGGFSSAQRVSTYFQSLSKFVEENGISQFVDFVSFLEFQRLVEMYSSASVYVLPSLQDAYPYTVVEAMMCGTPVIGTSSGGMVEQIVDGEVGYVVPPGDAQALAEKILYLHEHPDLLSEMSNRTRQYAKQRFSPESFPLDVFNAIIS